MSSKTAKQLHCLLALLMSVSCGSVIVSGAVAVVTAGIPLGV